MSNQPIWEQENRELLLYVEELENRIKELIAPIEVGGGPGRHLVTIEQLDTAWLMADGDEFALAVLTQLGIVRCEDCGGEGMEFIDATNCTQPGPSGVPCPGCNGYGWVKHE